MPEQDEVKLLDTSSLDGLRPEHELLLALSRPQLSVDERRRIRLFLTTHSEAIEWGVFIDQACRHMVMPLVARHLTQFRLTLSDEGKPLVPYRWLYTEAYEGSRRRNLVLASEYARVLHALNDSAVRYLIRKGPVLGEHFYHDLAARRISNLDVFMQRADYPLLQQVLTDLGYQVGELTPNGSRIVPFDRRTELYWKVNLTNTSLPHARVGDHDTVESYLVSTMFSLFQPMLGIRDDAGEVLDASVPTTLYGVPARMLHLADQLLDSCFQIHLRATLFYYIESGKDLLVRNFLDLVHLLMKATPDCIEEFRGRVERFDLAKSAYYSLHFTRQLYPDLVPERLVDSFRPVDISYLEEYGAFDGEQYTWNRRFAERLFDPRRKAEVAGRSKVPGPRSMI
ncbi:nucleotidyltransferase family protein [Micromonospora sp. NPDC048935]|uniref:nucleotidyltransferase family protein n=1 Tax=Micromonospora sp. NPDC048935 TaxID=3364262 RepID=UPI0037245173